MSDSSTQRNTRFWKGLLRAGTNALPSDGLNTLDAYPVYVDRLRSRVVGAGDSLRKRIDGGLAVDDPDSWKPPHPMLPQGATLSGHSGRMALSGSGRQYRRRSWL